MMIYLNKHNLKSMFKLINIDNIPPPEGIDIVPIIIDSDMIQPLKGKAVFEYLLNVKYFDNETNNIDYVKLIPTNPIIQQDSKAVNSEIHNLEINKYIFEHTEFTNTNLPITKPKVLNKKLSTLRKLKNK